MVYTSQLIEQTTDTGQLFDPEVVDSAKKIYHTYYHLHGELTRTPIGVAVDRKTYRGQLLFTKIPILLPGECFVPIDELESE
ncbi:hypothetical protein [Gloeocapsa sp. PCC 73106]|uniref:hypothetical protein n=1 Tax=Gloeocapsa sp. PCC 73106 TaxID=102232 RepID=UPI0002AC7703|nr:hypothetical protein [Gloeocapsa sp. PCC 73106]ELR97178.1 hypothetical protein GLO73106DRAFT_00009830 [Gloeocapsa sp. PCC 73106]